MGLNHAAYHLQLWIAPGFTEPAYTMVFHASFNPAGNMFFGGLEPALLSWLIPAAFLLSAARIVLLFGQALAARPAARAAGP